MLRSAVLSVVVYSVLAAFCTTFAQDSSRNTAIKKQAAQYREILEKSADELAKVGDDKAIEVIVELTYGRSLAKQESKESSAENANLKLQEYFNGLKARYEEIQTIVNNQTRLIREEHPQDKKACDRKILALIDSFREEHSRLRKHGSIAKKLIARARQDLGLARDLVSSIERQKEQLARKLKFTDGSSPIDLV